MTTRSDDEPKPNRREHAWEEVFPEPIAGMHDRAVRHERPPVQRANRSPDVKPGKLNLREIGRFQHRAVLGRDALRRDLLGLLDAHSEPTTTETQGCPPSAGPAQARAGMRGVLATPGHRLR